MKNKLILIAIILAALLLVGFRYSIVEQADMLPDEVRLTLNGWFGEALAETEPPVSSPSDAPTNTPEPTAEPTPVPTPAPTPEPLLERGDRGEEVRALQKRLRELGFMTGAADGKYGPKTEEAVLKFKQHVYRLYEEHLERERLAREAEAMLREDTEENPAQADVNEDDKAENEAADGHTEENPAQADVNEDEAAEDDSADEHTEGNPAQADRNEDEAAEDDTADGHTEVNPAQADVNEDEAAEDETADGHTEGNPAQADVSEDEAAENDTADEHTEEPVMDGKVDEETYRLLIEKGFDEYQARLSHGSRGAEVSRLQEKLKILGYLTGRADGIFGQKTARAVTAFQQRNKLAQDGIAGERTQRLLFSEAALRQIVRPAQPYLLKVSTGDQRVYAYAWSDADAGYTKLVRTMVCSTGLPETPTPKGTFKSTSPVVTWGYFPKYDVWAQYLYRIQGPYLFHSVLYDEADESTVKWGSVNKLGSPASHGCIRLSVEDAGWIYKNCPAGTTVTVY